jgi:hypothetical protein
MISNRGYELKAKWARFETFLQEKKREKLTSLFVALILALNLISAFTSSTLLLRDATISGVS